MDFEKINADDTLNQGRIKINNISEAVGGQISELKSDLTNKKFAELHDVSFEENMIDLSCIADGFINENGNYQYQPNWHMIDKYVPVKPNTKYYRLVNSEYEQIVLYDKNKNFISILRLFADNGTGKDGYFETPENCYFIKFQATKSQCDYNTQVYSQIRPTKYVESNTKANIKIPYEIITNKLSRKIVGYGDSMMASTSASTGNDIVALLGKMTKRPYINRGAGGAKTEEIMGVIGCLPLYIQPFTLPANKYNLVNISVKNSLGHSVRPVGGVCTVNGIKCYFANITQDLSNLQIARQEDGTEVQFKYPTPILYDGLENKDSVMLLWYGNNDQYGADDFEEYCNYTDMAISFNGNQDYLIIGLTSLIWTPQAVELNAKAQMRYGDKFVNVRDFLINYGLQYCDITPSDQDNIDIANNEIPSSLRADVGHLNDNGCRCVSYCLYERGKSLGYW